MFLRSLRTRAAHALTVAHHARPLPLPPLLQLLRLWQQLESESVLLSHIDAASKVLGDTGDAAELAAIPTAARAAALAERVRALPMVRAREAHPLHQRMQARSARGWSHSFYDGRCSLIGRESGAPRSARAILRGLDEHALRHALLLARSAATGDVTSDVTNVADVRVRNRPTAAIGVVKATKTEEQIASLFDSLAKTELMVNNALALSYKAAAVAARGVGAAGAASPVFADEIDALRTLGSGDAAVTTSQAMQIARAIEALLRMRCRLVALELLSAARAAPLSSATLSASTGALLRLVDDGGVGGVGGGAASGDDASAAWCAALRETLRSDEQCIAGTSACCTAFATSGGEGNAATPAWTRAWCYAARSSAACLCLTPTPRFPSFAPLR